MLGFLANALCFCLCRAQNQALASPWPRGLAQPGGARAQPIIGQPKAPNHPSRPMLARVLAFLANALHCLAFFGLVLSYQVKICWVGPDFSRCVVPLTPQRAAGSFELPQAAKNGCCTCILGHAWAVLPPPPLTWAHDRPHVAPLHGLNKSKQSSHNEPHVMLQHPC